MAAVPVPRPLLRRVARRALPARVAARRADARWRAEVEPGLRADARLLRFARPPVPLAAAALDVALVDDPAALTATRAPWTLVLEPGARPASGALELLGRAAAAAPDAGVLTVDEDRLDRRGARTAPWVKPGPSPDLLAHRDLAGAGVLVQRERALAAGVPADHPRWRHEVCRRLTGPDGAGAAHVQAVLVHRAPGAPPHPAPPLPAPPAVRGEPAVEVVVPFRDAHGLLRRAVGSLLERTAWERLRVTLVDNGSSAPPPPELVRDPRVAVRPDPRPFNYAALNNAAAAASRADVLVFLNNDTEVVEPGWLERLVAEAQRPEVGAVGPLLTYADGRVQHAGVALGLFGGASHPYAGLQPGEPTPFGPAAGGTRNWLAVTGACLVIERAAFAQAGGFDERFVVTGQDVDLGVRLSAAGRRSLCVTDVLLVHDEARTRDPNALDPGDVERSGLAYAPFLPDGDPFYPRALTRASTNCALRMPGERW
jgi:GT2 family glycosyltransferase